MSDATSPAEELQKLEDELEANQKDAERLKAEIAGLKKTAGEVDQKTKDLEKAADDLNARKADLDHFVTREKKMLEEIVDKDAIQKLKKAATDALDALKGKIETAATDVQKASDALAAAKKVTAEKQAAFNKVTAIPATNAEILKDALSLRDKANEAGKANSFSQMYFLVLVLADRLDKLDLTTPAEYTKKLNQAAADLTAASNAERAAKEALDDAVAAQKEAQKNFDDKRAKWREETLKLIPAGNGAAPARPSAPSTPPPTPRGGSEAPPPA